MLRDVCCLTVFAGCPVVLVKPAAAAVVGLFAVGGSTSGVTPATRRAPTTDRNRNNDADVDDGVDDNTLVEKNGYIAATTTTIPDTGARVWIEMEQLQHAFTI